METINISEILKETSKVVMTGNGSVQDLVKKYKSYLKSNTEFQDEIKNAIIILKRVIQLQKQLNNKQSKGNKFNLKSRAYIFFLVIILLFSIYLASARINYRINDQLVFESSSDGPVIIKNGLNITAGHLTISAGDLHIDGDIVHDQGYVSFTNGNFSIDTDAFFLNPDNNRIGIGTTDPQRILHIQDDNGVIRIDRDTNSPGFILARFPNNNYTTPWKSFIFGVAADDSDNGTFHITDIHTNVAGGGDRRLTIENDGTVNIPGDLDVPEVSNTLGDLKIQPDVQGNVILFGDTDVANDEDGGEIRGWRNAPEGNDYWRIYLTDNRKTMFHSSTDMTFQGQSTFIINSVDDNIFFKLGDSAGAKEVRVRDKSGMDVSTIDSNGNAWYRGDVEIGVDSDVLIQANGDSYFNGGYVGIGITTPGLPLEVRSADDNQAMFFDSRSQAQGVGGGIAFGGKYTDAGAEAMAGRIGVQKTNGISGDVGFDIVISTQDSVGSITSRIECTSDGKCGFHVPLFNSPSKALDVWGDARIRGNFTIDEDLFIKQEINIDTISEYTQSAGVSIEQIIFENGDIYMDTSDNIFFHDTEVFISSESDGHLDLTADDVIDINANEIRIHGELILSQNEATISSGGAITVDKNNHRVDTYGDASTDNLDTINNGQGGQILILRTESNARDVTIRDEVGNIKLVGGVDFTLDTMYDKITFVYDIHGGGYWIELSRSNID